MYKDVCSQVHLDPSSTFGTPSPHASHIYPLVEGKSRLLKLALVLKEVWGQQAMKSGRWEKRSFFLAVAFQLRFIKAAMSSSAAARRKRTRDFRELSGLPRGSMKAFPKVGAVC